jgi:hypothetical protein
MRQTGGHKEQEQSCFGGFVWPDRNYRGLRWASGGVLSPDWVLTSSGASSVVPAHGREAEGPVAERKHGSGVGAAACQQVLARFLLRCSSGGPKLRRQPLDRRHLREGSSGVGSGT